MATTPRDAFFRLGEFGLLESKRVWDEPDLGGMPDRNGIAGRFSTFLEKADQGPEEKARQADALNDLRPSRKVHHASH